MASPLSWFARLSLAQALAVASVWPIGLVVVGIGVVLVRLWPHVVGANPYYLSVSGGPFLAIVAIGPSLLIVAVWAIARKRGPGAT